MATTARDLLDQASRLLSDPQYANWSASELLGYLNEGLRVLVPRVPSQFAAIQTLDLDEGTKQSIPATGAALIRVGRNINADSTPGRAPRFVLKQDKDAFNPNWHYATAGATREWMYDPVDPKVFWVSPPAVAGAKLEIEFAEYPADLIVNSVMPVDKAYFAPLVDYVAYRALSTDAAYAAEDGRANIFYNAFLEKTGGNSPKPG